MPLQDILSLTQSSPHTRMNLSLRDVVCTSRDGDKFWKIPECYIRGNNIKYLRVPDEVIDKVVEEPKSMPPTSPPPLPLPVLCGRRKM